jgi:hypothetical protein
LAVADAFIEQREGRRVTGVEALTVNEEGAT